MMIVVVEDAPPRLRGRLAVWMLEVRAGVYVGNYSRRTREMIWQEVVGAIGEGNGVIAWAAQNDAGLSFETGGKKKRGCEQPRIKFKSYALSREKASHQEVIRGQVKRTGQ